MISAATIRRWAGGSAPKGSYRGVARRVVTPDETLAGVRRLLPVMGITRVANVTGLDSIGIPVVMVCRPNSRSLAVSQGKGIDLASARARGSWSRSRVTTGSTSHCHSEFATHQQLRYTHRDRGSRKPAPHGRQPLPPSPHAALDRRARPARERTAVAAVRDGIDRLQNSGGSRLRVLRCDEQRLGVR